MGGIIYLYSHLLIISGALEERAGKECVGSSAITSWERSLKITNEICINSPKNQIERLREENEELSKKEKYWKDAYLWLKREYEKEETKQWKTEEY